VKNVTVSAVCLSQTSLLWWQNYSERWLVFMAATELWSENFLSKHVFPIHNTLNAELNPMCHLLILLGDIKLMGKCIVSISNKMQRYTVYLYLDTALHVSVGTSTHHQERIQLYLQHLVFVTTPLLLSAAIVEELEQL
jgi:hypothetical protein